MTSLGIAGEPDLAGLKELLRGIAEAEESFESEGSRHTPKAFSHRRKLVGVHPTIPCWILEQMNRVVVCCSAAAYGKGAINGAGGIYNAKGLSPSFDQHVS